LETFLFVRDVFSSGVWTVSTLLWIKVLKETADNAARLFVDNHGSKETNREITEHSCSLAFRQMLIANLDSPIANCRLFIASVESLGFRRLNAKKRKQTKSSLLLQ